MKKYKPIKFSEDFVFDDNKLGYVFQVKKRSYLWLWLLLTALFLGLCCVRCNHDITVRVVDHVTQEPIAPTSVTLEYTEHALCKGGRVIYSNTYSQTLETDENGDVVFEDIPCSIFSYIFYAFSDTYLTANNDCNYLKTALSTCLFHYTWNTTLKLQPKTEDVQVLVTDKETDEPLAGAIIHYNFTLSGQIITDSVKTDAAGKTTIAGAPRCGNIQMERVSCYGYEDITHIDLPVFDAIEDPSNATIALAPKKDSFKFRVVNKNTKQPIPEASVIVMLTTSNGHIKRSPQVPTNVNGEGRGESDKAFILSMVSFHASKNHYRDTAIVTGLTLEKYRDLPEEKRIIELEPLPYEQVFQNADSITGQPIVGVMNVYTISGNGRTAPKDSVLSNAKGKFSIWAMEGDHIVIDSKCDPQYEPKHTDIASFKEGEKIPMKPLFITLNFKTIDANTNSLLPNCNLWIFDTEDNTYPPSQSGAGKFEVLKLPLNASITISAEKDKYLVNNSTIHKTNVLNLYNKYNNSVISIPLIPAKEYRYSGYGYHKKCYSFDNAPCTIDIEWKLCSACTLLTVYDGNGSIIERFGIDSPNGDGKGTKYTDSTGRKTIISTTSSVCVEMKNVNKDGSSYVITQIN